MIELWTRIIVGLLLASHGAQKLFGWFGGYGLAETGSFFVAKLGLPASAALVAGLIELGCGLLLVFGLATRVAAVVTLALMMAALLHTHFGAGIYWAMIGYEEPLLWSILMLPYAIRGGGRTAHAATATQALARAQTSQRLVARLTTMPWYRAKMPAASAAARRRKPGRADRAQRAVNRRARQRLR